MLEHGVPSLTALFVARARAIDDAPDGTLARFARAASLGLVEHVGLRTRAIDDVVERSIDGIRQLVVLGAGLDHRAWRMGILRDVSVFEVDHPSTQAWKRARLRGAAPRANDVRFVGVDFERDDLDRKLAASDHDPGKPTFWLWEGVTPYLTAPARAGTLRIVRERSAPGSRLAMTYGTPELVRARWLRERRWRRRVFRPTIHGLFRLLGEPLEGLLESAEAARLVESFGFVVESDDGSIEWAQRARRPEPNIVVAERLLVARRFG